MTNVMTNTVTNTLTKSQQTTASDAALEQAALWFIQQEQTDSSSQHNAQQQQEFNVWLQQAEHKLAWQKILTVSQTFDAFKQTGQARQSEHTGQVDIASSTLSHLHQPSQSFSRRSMLKGFAVAAVVGFTWQFSADIRQYVYSRQAQYQTAVGETRQQKLSDGSHLWLNTDSALNELFNPHKRELALYQGEVYINTAADSQRPFFVSATLASKPITYTALGTEFSIEQNNDDSQLHVFKGRVAVDYNQQRVILSAGEQVTITEYGFSVITAAETDSLAWQQRELRAKNISLADFCRQLERYHTGIITLSEQAAQLRVVGIFPIFDLEASLQMIAQSLPVTVHQHLLWWTRIH
ncbi:hypothetical protein A9Q74_00910 [Colwellia sp. 39_35_sub15_T18]|nr:hypothetical protein A9Q74_00910 [Colwellia sp. 39_35_sub15_T18]